MTVAILILAIFTLLGGPSMVGVANALERIGTALNRIADAIEKKGE